MEGCDGEPRRLPGRADLPPLPALRRGRGQADLGRGRAPSSRKAGPTPASSSSTRRRPRRSRSSCPAVAQAHVEACGSDDDLLIGLQLTHSGRYSCPRPLLAQHDPLLDPRTIVDKATGATAGPESPLLTDDELDRLQDRYVEAAELAFRIGFDFVDLKQCHRYLLNELLAARTRPGKYGGSFENRTRFIRELVGRIRDAHPGG